MNRSPRHGLAAGLVGIVVLGATATAVAHHSFAMYDRTTTRTLTGRLTRFIPGANHAQLIFELLGPDGKPVVDAKGEVVQWGVETGPAGAIARQGVTVKSFPVGTVLTVTLNPLRDGRTFGALAGILIKCGATLPAGGCTEETGEVLIRQQRNE
jgi:hypothetical protein